jgi:hypothetical protein
MRERAIEKISEIFCETIFDSQVIVESLRDDVATCG